MVTSYRGVRLMGMSKVSYLIKRYWAVVTFPTIVAVTIYADWSHTQQWKKEIANKEKLH
ncbi:uncharacterized protein LOC143147768 isoform X2 [Ptiloglossa arizonensis]|uniref:uncharacterized protein LOC143147768 isoform X2 n=1 Tax=Ptiloglossa arizonensis TaxID=3350558 RepID=UPI003FA080D5